MATPAMIRGHDNPLSVAPRSPDIVRFDDRPFVFKPVLQAISSCAPMRPLRAGFEWTHHEGASRNAISGRRWLGLFPNEETEVLNQIVAAIPSSNAHFRSIRAMHRGDRPRRPGDRQAIHRHQELAKCRGHPGAIGNFR